MTHFLPALAGGVLIGLSAALMLLVLGRIAGVSGSVVKAATLTDRSPAAVQSLLFLIGLPLGALVVAALAGPIVQTFPPSGWMLAAGGLLVGFGARLGNGCTSGHGVCGVSRLSPRSLAATATFIGAGVAMVALLRLIGLGW